MVIIVWGREECFLCNRMKGRLTKAGLDFAYMGLDPILKGECDTTSPLYQDLVNKFEKAGNRMPIVQLYDGREYWFMSYPEAVKWLKETKRGKQFIGGVG